MKHPSSYRDEDGATSSETTSAKRSPRLDSLLSEVSGERFTYWYREKQYRENIENGQPYFNTSRESNSPERHSPSRLLQCHRQLIYRRENAPKERSPPEGIFWFGQRFEEDIIFPFLRSLTDDQTYVQNSIWIDITEESAVGDLQVKGSTDPVFVDSDAIPILPTEIKTKSSVDNLTEPNRHHRAQVHAYLVGLSEKFDRDISDAIILYGSRKSLDVKVFHVEFDREFWQDTVLDWAESQTEYRLNDDLPPADPEYDWECKFCAYRSRCGQGDSSHQDYPPNGLLPQFERYPRQQLVEYLEGHPEESLTPTLGRQFPELVDDYGVSDWYCEQCQSRIGWQEVEPDGQPLCPRCADKGDLSELTLSHNKPTETGESIPWGNE